MRRLLIIAIVAALGWAIVGGTMSNAAERLICSPMSGTLIGADGTPAAGVTVRREWIYDRKTGSDSVTTDADGRFALGAVEAPRRGLFAGLSTPVVGQRY